MAAHVRLPGTDLDVHPLCLGGNVFGWTAAAEASAAVLDAYRDAGGTLVDTADSYTWRIEGNTGGDSERVLGDWLSSIERLKALPETLFVLPSHGEPFTGLHARLDALAHGHRDRLDALHAHLAEPRRAVDCFSILFARKIDDGLMGLATGEALAHLRHLEVEGRATREARDGVNWYRASCAAG